MTDETTLLSCPFCGGEASKRLFYKGKYRVHCNVCDAHSGDVCDTEAEAIAAWNTRVAHVMLTAEQVRELIAPHLHARPTFDFGRHGAVWVADFQAIADELNAELGSGTCKITATATNDLMYPDYMTKWYELSCGHSLTLKGDEAPKWCAVCGKAVER